MTHNILAGNWITAAEDLNGASPVFRRKFILEQKKVRSAMLAITALGLYEASLNGRRIGTDVLQPGFTAYQHRLQYQTYDVTELLEPENELTALVGNGWAVGRIGFNGKVKAYSDKPALIATLAVEYQDGSRVLIITDRDWEYAQSKVRFSDIYDGETYDASWQVKDWKPVLLGNYQKENLIPQEGAPIREHNVFQPILLKTPRGETVLDFGQNLTGYVRFTVKGEPGAVCELSHGEILDKDGNFYNENLRSAKAKLCYICDGTEQTYQPHFTFMGFRYVRVDQWPEEVDPSRFEAVAVHSYMERTGWFECSSSKVNQLYRNIIWGQKGNFLDIPTDCPQRDERLGWTGDAQVFIRAAAYNYDVEQFFRKWLKDLAAEQEPDGSVPDVIPNVFDSQMHSAAWGDAAVICPWQLYLTYGHKDILENQFHSMKRWIDYIRSVSEDGVFWKGGTHFGDWLGLDAPAGSYKGSTDPDLIAQAYFAYSTSLLIKAGKVLGENMEEYELLYQKVRGRYQQEFIRGGELTCNTQTAYVITLYFHLCDQPIPFARHLAQMIEDNGNRLQTGFVGTPYLLHALSENGYAQLAYTLLLQEDFPSWLYSVNQGATTIWEHWDGINEKGEMWSTDMNSFNHYAYGSVADWMYGVMAGICPDESAPGYRRILFRPITDKRLSSVQASLKTVYGKVASGWYRANGKTVYIFDVPSGCTAEIQIENQNFSVEAGHYEYKI
ncbi:alpha-L-rhamnosidase [Massiliimalia timonensis]|uniref:alpha-L-rhamnosidase n=1 Tax=Massiliimalia timonensis TaxID=1987501 RepID=UPI000B8ABFAF|nr:alpha-L-rhamnosidase [Massiliimalia timonensis]MBS7174556.1 family 78 glycoside hydrolase catalytic domain [Clostridiales bacterium]